ncbi:hypothetical protein AOLI_G00305030 [Acnodon oligacanthus]
MTGKAAALAGVYSATSTALVPFSSVVNPVACVGRVRSFLLHCNERSEMKVTSAAHSTARKLHVEPADRTGGAVQESRGTRKREQTPGRSSPDGPKSYYRLVMACTVARQMTCWKRLALEILCQTAVNVALLIQPLPRGDGIWPTSPEAQAEMTCFRPERARLRCLSSYS